MMLKIHNFEHVDYQVAIQPAQNGRQTTHFKERGYTENRHLALNMVFMDFYIMFNKFSCLKCLAHTKNI